MSIWKQEINLKALNDADKNTLTGLLNIEFIDYGDDFLKGRMPIQPKVLQIFGIMHGGASCVFTEAVGSAAAQYCVDENHYCVGLDINTNHIRSIRSGVVTGEAKPFHLGSMTQVWGVNILDEDGRVISVNRLTMAVLKKK